MTGREITAARKQLPSPTQVPWKDWTKEQKQADRELSCREMINSILCYDGKYGIQKDSVHYKNYLADYVSQLGEETVDRLCKEQIEDFEKAVVRYAGTDGEGLSYKSITWADEVEPLDKQIEVAAEQKNVVQDDNSEKDREGVDVGERI